MINQLKYALIQSSLPVNQLGQKLVRQSLNCLVGVVELDQENLGVTLQVGFARRGLGLLGHQSQKLLEKLLNDGADAVAPAVRHGLRQRRAQGGHGGHHGPAGCTISKLLYYWCIPESEEKHFTSELGVFF